MGSGGVGLVVGAFGLISVGWHVAVLVLLVMIWQRVRHLPVK